MGEFRNFCNIVAVEIEHIQYTTVLHNTGVDNMGAKRQLLLLVVTCSNTCSIVVVVVVVVVVAAAVVVLIVEVSGSALHLIQYRHNVTGVGAVPGLSLMHLSMRDTIAGQWMRLIWAA